MRCARQKRLFFSKEISVCRHEISFCFTLNFFAKQNPFNFFLKQTLRSTIYFSVIPCFEKNLMQHSTGNKVYRACFYSAKLSQIETHSEKWDSLVRERSWRDYHLVSKILCQNLEKKNPKKQANMIFTVKIAKTVYSIWQKCLI